MQQISNIFDNYKGGSLWLMYNKSDIINNYVKVILHVSQFATSRIFEKDYEICFR